MRKLLQQQAVKSQRNKDEIKRLRESTDAMSENEKSCHQPKRWILCIDDLDEQRKRIGEITRFRAALYRIRGEGMASKTDIVERLRQHEWGSTTPSIFSEAADDIERLRAALRRIRQKCTDQRMPADLFGFIDETVRAALPKKQQ